MKSFTQTAAQGDILFNKVDDIPNGFIEMKKNDGSYVVAHSETGHHHTVSQHDCVVFHNTQDPMIMFMKLIKPSVEIKHHRTFDTHETLKADGGVGSIYEIRRQREYTPEGWRRVED